MQREMGKIGEEIYFLVCLSELEFYCVSLYDLVFTM